MFIRFPDGEIVNLDGVLAIAKIVDTNLIQVLITYKDNTTYTYTCADYNEVLSVIEQILIILNQTALDIMPGINSVPKLTTCSNLDNSAGSGSHLGGGVALIVGANFKPTGTFWVYDNNAAAYVQITQITYKYGSSVYFAIMPAVSAASPGVASKMKYVDPNGNSVETLNLYTYQT